MAQTVLSNAPYTAEWTAIDSLVQQGLPQSARDELYALRDKITEDSATEENLFSHEIKTLLYEMSLNAQLEEQGSWSAIWLLEEIAGLAGSPKRAIYDSYLAESYFNYYQQNRWQINGRTEIADSSPTEDETTWAANDFLSRVTDLYLSSLADERLREVSLTELSPLVYAGENSEDIRPTVYDLLLHRALDHFSAQDAFLGEPSYQSAFDDLRLLGPVKEFIGYKFPETEQPTSTQRSLTTLQNALRWSQNTRPNSLAQADLNLRRLQFVYDYLQLPAKDEAYEAALNRLAKRYANTNGEAMVLVKLMKYHQQRGYQYSSDQPDKATLKWSLKTAYELASDVAKRFSDTPYAQQARSLMYDLDNPSLNVKAEAVQLPGQSGLVALTYDQVEQVHFKIVSASLAEYQEQNRKANDIRKIVDREALQSWSEKLPDDGAFRDQTAETSFRGLPKGLYCLVASSRTDFSFEQGATAMLFFWVSELGLLTDGNYSIKKLMVVNRATGQPLAGVSVNLWGNRRRNDSSERKIASGLLTDENGQVELTKYGDNYLEIELTKGDDHLFTSDRISTSSGERISERVPYGTFFMDRSIYRPGQNVHFKLLVMQDEDSVPELLPNHPLTVKLFNTNHQEVAELNLTTNRFGSVNGIFTLPTGGLLGSYYLKSSLSGGNNGSFRVEEYKRPRFEAKLADLAAAPKLGDPVKITGTATAYAGPAIADAEVNYTVTRNVNFPWFYGRSFWRSFPPASQAVVTLKTGTVRTDAAGQFEIEFTAEADASLQADRLPTYEFKITTDVVDGTGETRSANKTIRLAKHPLQLGLTTEQSHGVAAGIDVSLSCTNLDGVPQQREIQLVVEQLDAPTQNFIDRYWQRPEHILLKEKTFRQQFPLFQYADKEEQANWAVLKQWSEQTVLIEEETEKLNIATANWPVGHYRLRMFVVTESGDTLSKVEDVVLHNWAANKFASGDWLYLKQDQQRLQPGETAQLTYGTTKPLYIHQEQYNARGKSGENWLNTAENTPFSTQVQEKDRGTITWYQTYVLHNRVYAKTTSWLVPWTNKELTINYESFRSKLYPDAQEEWILRIDGPGKERVAAELLASMYDASLDQIYAHDWGFSPFPQSAMYRSGTWQGRYFKELQVWPSFRAQQELETGSSFRYPSLFSSNTLRGFGRGRGYMSRSLGIQNEAYPATYSSMSMDDAEADSAMAMTAAPPPSAKRAQENGGVNDDTDNDNEQNVPPPTKVRTNLSETAFFFPTLQTDEAGRVAIKFRMPESLTRWKLQLLAHTEDLAFALGQKEVITQKELMILPNAPRFLREGDELVFTAKVSNLSEGALPGSATLELFDLNTELSLNANYELTNTAEVFDLPSKASQTVSWKIRVPKAAAGVIGYRVIARAGNFSDGEEAAIPVLTNRVLLTEAKPLFVRPGKSKTVELGNLLNAKPSADHQSFQLDITSNPAWEAIKALPYLQEYPYDCTEQLVNRYYANALASTVANRYPVIREVFEDWKQEEEALKSPLLTNPSLKLAVIEETPWLMQAKEESLQREQIAILFEADRLATELVDIANQLIQRQANNGGFSWFPGGRENWYITQYYVEQLSHLQALEADILPQELVASLERAVVFCDQQAFAYYNKLKDDKGKIGDVEPSAFIAHYLYMRSLQLEVVLAENHTEMYNYWWQQVDKHWLKSSLFSQALITLAATATNRPDLAQRIYRSLRERSLQSDELGRYWKYGQGYFWHQLPIETHVKLLEVYRSMNASEEELTDLKIWLLCNKESNRWETTKATAAAVHALVSSGEDWLGETASLDIRFPELDEATYQTRLTEAQDNAEAGTGSYQVRWEGQEVQAELGSIRLKNKSKVPGWGAMYWQHFANIDEVERADDNPLRIERELYRKANSGQGDQLQALTTAPKPGDLITVRLVVRTDRDMEFVHLKDLRASGLEPIDQLSGYHYTGGLGFYQQTTDLGTHFFMDYLPKGEYVLEYQLRVFHEGDFSGGLAQLQCMYAPKFSSHSEGRRLKVERQ